MHDDVDVQVPGRRDAHGVQLVLLNDNQPEDLRVGQHGEDHHDDGHGTARFAQQVLLERKVDGDESFDGHTEHDPGRHEETQVFAEVVDLAGGVVVGGQYARPGRHV